MLNVKVNNEWKKPKDIFYKKEGKWTSIAEIPQVKACYTTQEQIRRFRDIIDENRTAGGITTAVSQIPSGVTGTYLYSFLAPSGMIFFIPTTAGSPILRLDPYTDTVYQEVLMPVAPSTAQIGSNGNIYIGYTTSAASVVLAPIYDIYEFNTTSMKISLVGRYYNVANGQMWNILNDKIIMSPTASNVYTAGIVDGFDPNTKSMSRVLTPSSVSLMAYGGISSVMRYSTIGSDLVCRFVRTESTKAITGRDPVQIQPALDINSSAIFGDRSLDIRSLGYSEAVKAHFCPYSTLSYTNVGYNGNVGYVNGASTNGTVIGQLSSTTTRTAYGNCGPNGYMYLIGSTAVRVTTYKDNSTTPALTHYALLLADTGTTTSWGATCYSFEGNLYAAPRSSNNILKISFNGVTKPIDRDILLSGWLNNM